MSELKCVQCSHNIAADQQHLKCSVCFGAHHLGPVCAGVAEATFASMGAKRDKWRCKQCRGQAASQSEPCTVSEQLADITEKLGILVSIKERVESLSSLEIKIDDLLTLKPQVESLKSVVSEVQLSLDNLSRKYDTILTENDARDATVTALSTQVQDLETCVSSQASIIEQLQSDLNDSEQYSRLANLEIHCLPVTPNENLPAILTDFAVKLGIPFSSGDVVAAHRLAPLRNKPAPVLVRFTSVKVRNLWLDKRSKLRGCAQNNDLPVVFFSENLTKKNRELYWAARTVAKDKSYKFVWVKNGHTFLKKREGDPSIRVSPATDLTQLA